MVIDAGHGGKDPGVIRNRLTSDELEKWSTAKEVPTPTPTATKSPDKTEQDTDSPEESSTPTTSPKTSIWDGGTGKVYQEKDIALSVALKVKKLLEDKNVKVILTRDKDTYLTLDERPAIAIENNAALFLSLHTNSTNDTVTTANGIEIYYSLENNHDNYGITSKDFATEVLKKVISSTKAKDRGVKTANYLVVRKSTMPAALIEMGFLNNPDELENLISDEYQTKLAKGISEGIISSLSKVEIKEIAEISEESEIALPEENE